MASGLIVRDGLPEPHGVVLSGDGINVAVVSGSATRIELCLFDEADRETARIALPARTGDVFHGHVAGIGVGQRYGLRAHGPFAPREGHRFNAHKLLVDPHAAVLDRPFSLHPSMFGYRSGDPDADLSFDDSDSAPFMPKAVVMAARAPLRPLPLHHWRDTVLYELHVRGFTRLHPEVAEALRGTFAGLAQPAPLAHLRDLGISSIETLPLAAWIDERHLPPLGLSNYWGYNPVVFGAPDPRLVPGGWDELAHGVAALQAEGLETLIDVVYNHTGEGDELGPTLSLRGLDNAGYYRLDPTNPRRYVNHAGCGNTLALERPAALRLVMDSLRRFAEWGGVHGFRFDLATTLARREQGFDPDHPLLSAITQDPVLSRLKLIAEPWDIGPGGYQPGRFPAAWGEWNDAFRDGARRFWRGDGGLIGELATRLAGSADRFGTRRPLSRSINYVTAHDGFTLADLVSHRHKHNEANGEANRDGSDDNLSWNHGVEGPSDDPAIQSRRQADQAALLGTLILSRGTPMLSMGDELGRSQHGNNNAYAQDNPRSWLDWTKADTTLIAHVRRLLAARKAHPALRGDAALTGAPTDESGFPDVAWLRADGAEMTGKDWAEPSNRVLIAALHAEGDRVLVLINGGEEERLVRLPPPREGHGWRNLDGETLAESITLPPRHIGLLHEATMARRRGGLDDAVLDRLSRAAGIAPDWWDVGGSRHVVSRETKQALLAAMRLPAGSTDEARASLMRLSRDRDQRALPPLVTSRMGEPFTLHVPDEPARRRWILIADEAGAVSTLAIEPGAGQALAQQGLDGREHRRRRITLPPVLPMGRHRIILDGNEDEPCLAIVAPPRCWLPDALMDRPYGLAAHLYTLRRDGDQGIGDFTTLGLLGKAARDAGATTLGLNPLHALFGDDRERASPYHPSDRRRLDPIYLDVTALPCADAPEIRAALARHADTFAILSQRDSVDYPGVWDAKLAVLKAAYMAFERAGDLSRFETFVAQQGRDLTLFAAHEVLRQRFGGPGSAWPEAYAHAGGTAVAALIVQEREAIRFVQFQQWLADEALGAAAGQAGLRLGFYRDLAVGAAPDGAEAWAGQHRLATTASIGAPPDPFSESGQVWHLPPPDPQAIRAEAYAGQASLLAANMRHAGALRIDHAMGLERLFWVPEGASARDGAYVGYQRDEQLAVLALQSHRARCLVIGEDLGTVPDGFRQALERDGILSYRVLWLEREGLRFSDPRHYPAHAAACLGSHDLPTLRGWWLGHDIDEALALGLIDDVAAARQREDRLAEQRALLDLTGITQPPEDGADDALVAALHGLVASAPSWLMLAQADDLTVATSRINLPGTDRERPNWRRKLPQPIESLLTTPRARSILAAMQKARTPS